MLKLFISIIFLTTMTTAHAEMKMLICQSQLTEDFLNELPKPFQTSCDDNGLDSCPEADKKRQEAEVCRQRGVSWSHQFIITFDTESLESAQGTAELRMMPCWWGRDLPMKAEVSSTPSLIYFTTVMGKWIVNRKTLRAGWDNKGNFQCVIQDVDTSDNLI
ncbi:MAG: hypothetical protein H6984_10585 [Pseudomonadales bacterium]|nr:hypothetical protein [Pseudomonadales bacterium]MCP5193851.1 hypothetical protein [Pseudomonadales bacterium]